MKSVSALLAAAALAVVLPAAAQAQTDWQSMNQRRETLDHRIDMGVRDGTLTRREANNLRTRFVSLVQLERQYRRHGLSRQERWDLSRRYDVLSDSIRDERADWQHASRSYDSRRHESVIQPAAARSGAAASPFRRGCRSASLRR